MSDITASEAASTVILKPGRTEREGWEIDEERADTLKSAFDATQSYGTWRMRFLNGQRRLYGTLALIFGILCVVLIATVAYLVPVQHLVPVLLVIQPDGTVDSESRIQDLPPNKELAVVRAALWKYIKDRESYTWDDTPGRYRYVSETSSKAVRDDYQKWMDFHNASSPQKLARDGHIGVEMISLVFTSPNIAVARYKRTLEEKGKKPVTTTWTAALDFELTSRLPSSARDEGDPGGIVVTNYAASQDTPSS